MTKNRTIFGKIVKYLFNGFNVIYIPLGLYTLSKSLSSATTENHNELIWLCFWIIIPVILIWIFGNLVLGLLTLITRPKNKNI
jgi:hypothetical protein